MKDRKPRAECPSERQEQKAVVEWARLNPAIRDLLFSIQNEHSGDARSGHQRKLVGVLAGVFDLFLPLPMGKYHGLWVEMKRKYGSRPSQAQINWHTRMTALGYQAHFCYGYDDAIRVIKDYLQIRSL